MQTVKDLPVKYPCYFSRSREGEQFVPEHTISYVFSGRIEMNDGLSVQSFNAGDLYFCRRNQLVKYNKYPEPGGEFNSISIFFDQSTLRNFSLEYGHMPSAHAIFPAFQSLSTDGMLSSYMQSLKIYEHMLGQPGSRELLAVKQKEAILILLQFHPKLKDVLFDFSEPGKVDLEAFMNKNFHFNVELQRFAYLTGRSLSTFKRDFIKVFGTTPSRWLVKRRLQEAHYLLREKRKNVSDIYLELGFEDLSHFSFAFKKQYGKPPSLV